LTVDRTTESRRGEPTFDLVARARRHGVHGGQHGRADVVVHHLLELIGARLPASEAPMVAGIGPSEDHPELAPRSDDGHRHRPVATAGVDRRERVARPTRRLLAYDPD